jgi:DUF4097 and DUF4098 domain-containing protein YvlB
MRIRFVPVLTLMLLAPLAADAQLTRNFRSEQRFTLVPGSTLLLENRAGDVIVEGAAVTEIEALITKTIQGADENAIEEGRRQTNLVVGGDARNRILRTTVAPEANHRWRASVTWRLRVPQQTHVRIVAANTERVHVSNVGGHVHVKSFSGAITLDNIGGTATVENTNGPVLYRAPEKPRANAFLSTVNGDITVRISPRAGFRWVAEALKGDVRTNLPARGAFFGSTFRGTINQGGPLITTATLIGSVHLLAEGTHVRTAESLRGMKAEIVPTSSGPGSLPSVSGIFRYSTNLGDVRVQEVRGDAEIYTGAGEVQLGAVSGSCEVQSMGGPLQIGEIAGRMGLSTAAGDVLVDTARRGGTITTAGGTIRLFYTGGPTALSSGGGDIVVRQAAAPVEAKTVSGDVMVTLDAGSRSESVDLRTEKGSIILNVPPGFRADVDAVIMTSDPKSDTIFSQIPGLTITREPAGAKTRVRATGKLNGGGQRIVLRATDGDINISEAEARPTVVRTR